jgi:3-oxoacyl-[acyl-carrier-protein] synthase I
MNDSRRIAITGCGAVCGGGLTIEQLWAGLRDGRSAITDIHSFDATDWPARRAAELADVDQRVLVKDRKLHKLVSRTDLLGLYAADQAIQSSGLPAHRGTLTPEAAAVFGDRTGIFAGSGGGNYQSNYDFFDLLTAARGNPHTFGQELGAHVNPMWLLRVLPNNAVCHVGIRHHFKGANACITNQCVSGALAVAEAAEALRAGEAERAVALGHDTPCEPETVFHYYRLGLLSPDALRPFDQKRDGTVFGEGAAAVMLETLDTARARQAEVLGEYLGSGCACEATGTVGIRPDGDGLSRAIELALGDAGLSADAVGLVVAHGNGTRASDASEVLGLRRVFGDALPPVTAFKWAFGHLIAASGVLDFVLALKTLRERIAPGVATLNALDPELAPFTVSRDPQSLRSDIALVLCRGFGGMNVALLVRGGRCS